MSANNACINGVKILAWQSGVNR